jgi:hypothetical protein
MKLKIALAFILLLSAFSCKKDANNGPLIGKWRTTQIFYMNYMAEQPYIQFSPQGKVQSTYFSNCTGYSTSGNNLTLKFTGPPGLTEATYAYRIKNDTLTLYTGDSTGAPDKTFVKE